MAGTKTEKAPADEKSVATHGVREFLPEMFAPMVPFTWRMFGLNPFAMMKEANKEFERMLGGAFAAPQGTEWTPSIECKKQNGSFVIAAELPGMKKEEIKVEVTDNGLVLKGERKREKVEEKPDSYHSERAYGQFYRYITLPKGAKPDEVKAELNEGILKVTVPVGTEAENRRTVHIREHHQ